VTSQRPPDARITGGFALILETSGLNAKCLLRTLEHQRSFSPDGGIARGAAATDQSQASALLEFTPMPDRSRNDFHASERRKAPVRPN
jgi:hypothetical protein